MKKVIFLIIGLVAVGGIFFVFSQLNQDQSEQTLETQGKIKVVATFYPLEYFAKTVGGEHIELVTLTPSGGEPHDYEPTPRDIIHIKTADIFVMNGADFEPWAEKLLPELTQEKVKVIEMSEHVELIKVSREEQREEHEEESEGHHHETGEFDPHFWLSPVEAQKEVTALRDALKAVDPDHAERYEQNAAALLKRLSEIHTLYQTGLSQCETKEIITSHNAFAYLEQAYGFGVQGIAGLSPTEEPSPKHLAELVKLVKAENIEYIFTETLASPKFSETLAKETQIQTLQLNPIEGLTEQEKNKGKNFETLLQENLESLRLGLKCE